MDRQPVHERSAAHRGPAAEATTQRATALPDHRPAATAQRALAEAAQRRTAPVQLKGGGLPADLRAGIKQLAGHDLDDVNVHYNSDKPKGLNALAYAQGQDIHVGPGQEQHLPHEAWHVVQQREGRVRPTMAAGGEPINDDKALEKEADEMGARAMQMARDDG